MVPEETQRVLFCSWSIFEAIWAHINIKLAPAWIVSENKFCFSTLKQWKQNVSNHWNSLNKVWNAAKIASYISEQMEDNLDLLYLKSDVRILTRVFAYARKSFLRLFAIFFLRDISGLWPPWSAWPTWTWWGGRSGRSRCGANVQPPQGGSPKCNAGSERKHFFQQIVFLYCFLNKKS